MNDRSLPVYPSGSHSVAIELLRTGTAYNQTLSPGVTYLALCGDYPPAEFRIDLEQYKFSRYLQLLRYKEGLNTSSIQLAKEALQDIITKIFEEIPALQKESGVKDGWLHLRLIMSPQELAMLPFELALTPKGFQGARSKAFLLNPQQLTTLTREVRQVAPKKYAWPSKPRILFAWAAPEKSVPADDHVAILKNALLPWVCPKKSQDQPGLENNYDALLTILDKTTFPRLQSAVEQAVKENNPYTHIHILAHGIPIPDPDNGPRFALAMHLDSKGNDFSDLKTDPVDGDRLRDALLVVENDHTYIPAVVTIAACDGGNEGTNLLPGGSLAHLLHQSGVPYVLASQFPLSKDGSVQVIADFYPRLLCGEDPRTALYYARRVVERPDIHDWASLLAYARFPDDFEDQLEDVQLKVALEMMKAANSWTDFLVKNGTTDDEIYESVESRHRNAITKLENSLKRNAGIVKNPARKAEHLGLLGSAYKRLAEYLYGRGKQIETKREFLFKQSREALETAKSYYKQGHDLLLANHWTAVQYLSLTTLFKGALTNEYDRWCVTRFAAENDMQQATGQDRIWTLGTLAELYLLKPFLMAADEFETEKDKAMKKAGDYLDELAGSEFDFAKESTARQLERYIGWWPDVFKSERTKQMQAMAKQLREHLPALAD